MNIEVVITDDHKMMREGIKQLLELDPKIKVIGQAQDGEESLNVIKKLKPDIVLLDINMPVMNGIETLKEIKKQKIKTKVLMLTVHNEIEYLLKAVDIGVDGYILKDSDSNELKAAIYSIYNGENYIQPCLIPLLNSKMIVRDSDITKIDSLTKREMEILISIANGLINRQIAEHFGISERTVKNHVSNLFKKIDVSDRTQAAVFAIRNNLLHI